MNDPGAAPTWRSLIDPEPVPEKEPVGAAGLASILAARMCHDFISPASAIVSGVDLLEDPAAQDMREDAMNLITASAKKLVAHLAFTRVAFGGSSSAESFDTRELAKLAQGVFDHVRAELDWQVAAPAVSKPSARALLNLAQIAAGALPTGGKVTVSAHVQDHDLLISVDASGGRVRMRQEMIDGLDGAPLGEGLSGHWVQGYYLHALLKAAGGAVDHSITPERAVIRARCPAGDAAGG